MLERTWDKIVVKNLENNRVTVGPSKKLVHFKDLKTP